MSKKNFHDVRNAKKMLAHGVQNGFGSFRPMPAEKKSASSVNISGVQKQSSQEGTIGRGINH